MGNWVDDDDDDDDDAICPVLYCSPLEEGVILDFTGFESLKVVANIESGKHLKIGLVHEGAIDSLANYVELIMRKS